jgi:hypothetical protein
LIGYASGSRIASRKGEVPDPIAERWIFSGSAEGVVVDGDE